MLEAAQAICCFGWMAAAGTRAPANPMVSINRPGGSKGPQARCRLHVITLIFCEIPCATSGERTPSVWESANGSAHSMAGAFRGLVAVVATTPLLLTYGIPPEWAALRHQASVCSVKLINLPLRLQIKPSCCQQTSADHRSLSTLEILLSLMSGQYQLQRSIPTSGDMLRLYQSIIISLGALAIAQDMIRTASQVVAVDKGIPSAEMAASTLHTARLARRHGSLSLGQRLDIDSQALRLSGLRPARYSKANPKGTARSEGRSRQR